MRDVVQVQDFEILLRLLNMEQVRSQLRVIAAAVALDLLDDEMGVTLHKQLSGTKGQSDA
jgi:type II secretory pathway component PulK